MLKLKDGTARKKQPTNPDKKQQHKERKLKKSLLHNIKHEDWTQQLKEYKKNATEPL